MDAKQIAAIVTAVLSILGGTGAVVGWNRTSADLAAEQATASRRLSKYHAAKSIARACMGEEAFDAEWTQVLADLREAEGKDPE